MALTRRHFLGRVAAVGGAPLVYETMTGLGLLAPVNPVRFELSGQVSGIRVVILGAGLAGLAAAYELGKLGYQCQVLEPRARPGGRAYTVRRGTVSEEDGPRQVASFDEGLYFNAGPMRIAHHHTTTLNYCRELQVPVETFCISCDSTYLYQQNSAALAGKRIRQREARTDLDGYVAELLSKAVSQAELDLPLTKEDREALLDYLRRAGALDEGGRYRSSGRRGEDDEHRPTPALALRDLLNSKVGNYLGLDYDYQPTMLQIVGGTDRLPAAFAARLKDRVTYRAAAQEIRQSEHGVSIAFADQNGRVRQVDADYCVCAMPLTVLATLRTDFSREFQQAVKSVSYASAGKMGLQFKRRFWEEDDGIYGGATKTDQEITQIVYPSHGFHGPKGILVGYYIQGDNGRPMGERAPAERQALALEQGGRIHPQYRSEFETAFSVAWHRMTWSRGSWASMSPGARDALTTLRKPEGRVYLAGDHVSTLNAWMQGSFDSARQVAMAIHARAGQERHTARAAV
jgi:monoamine oxidase